MNPLERAAQEFERRASATFSMSQGAAHQRDADYCRNLSREQGDEVEALRGRLRDEIWKDVLIRLQEHDIDWEYTFPELYPDYPGCTPSRVYIRELTAAAETLASYTQGFSENRFVQEAKEVVERARTALAAFPNTEPSESCERCKGRGYLPASAIEEVVEELKARTAEWRDGAAEGSYEQGVADGYIGSANILRRNLLDPKEPR